MRRCVALIVAVLLLSATGCRQSAGASDPIGSGFSCRIQAQYKELDVAGVLERQNAGMLRLTFSAPETLEGLCAVWDGESVTLSFEGLEFSVDPDSVPESALGEEIVAVLDAAIRGEGDRREEDGQLIISGTGANGRYELICDAATGEPLSLSVPSLPLAVTFSEFTTNE